MHLEMNESEIPAHLKEFFEPIDDSSFLPAKNLCGIPQRFALAMQAAGWWWRSECIWWKKNAMPGSQEDRPTVDHEQVLMFTKSAKYYWDSEAVREPMARECREGEAWGGFAKKSRLKSVVVGQYHAPSMKDAVPNVHGRTLRTVWDIHTTPYAGAHFATMPPALVRRCLLASTSERGCCVMCGAPWVRVVERQKIHDSGRAEHAKYRQNPEGLRRNDTTRRLGRAYQDQLNAQRPLTLSWQPACNCFPIIEGTEPRPQPVPCCVLDPFVGSGTVLEVATQHFRRSIGIDLNGDYLPLITQRLRDEVLPFGLAHPGKE